MYELPIFVAAAVLGLLQTIGLLILKVIWSELKDLRTKVHTLGNEVAALKTAENFMRALKEGKWPQ